MTHKRILLADDEETIRFIIRLNLGNRFEIVEAIDGEDAWQKFVAAEGNFDLVIADLRMPRLAGDELVAQIQQKRPQTPAILLTGLLEPTLMPRPNLCILTKPLECIRLLQEAAHQQVMNATAQEGSSSGALAA